MLRIKRLYTFIIQTFFPLFIMTFGICLFIVLMQFIWRYVEDLVGKGLDNTVLAEFFLYAALQLVPMALPLSLLLASLMAFGNMGERLELLAIKASGVSLLKAMSPLIILVSLIAIGGFFYQNEVMPRVQVKARALFISIRQKSPELDIPEGSFYNAINNYSLFVKHKDPKTKMLRDVMIYDTSKGFNDMTVIICDSGMMRTSEDKQNLVLNLYHGQQFANFKQASLDNTTTPRRSSSSDNKFVPYSRENFKEKTVIIPFNAGFDRMDESSLDGTQISKNISQLTLSIDSMSHRLDSINIKDREVIGKHTYLAYRSRDTYYKNKKDTTDTSNNVNKTVATEEPAVGRIEFDSLFSTFSKEEYYQFVSSAANEAENSRFNLLDSGQKVNLRKNIRYHEVERHQKFTLSFACLIFFFIGAPLGAIIRKGGLGMPVVVSVCLFIVYYIINNIGYKFARDGVWEAWQGMWLSSAVLFPLGVFLTYKAMNDSTLFNPEAYGKFFRRILFIQSPKNMSEGERAQLIERIPSLSQLGLEPEIVASLQSMDSDLLRNMVNDPAQHDYMQQGALSLLKERGAELDDIIGNQSFEKANESYNNYQKSSLFTAVGYFISLIFLIFNIADFSLIIYVSYLVLFIRSLMYYFMFYSGVKGKQKIYHAIVSALMLIGYPVVFVYVKKRMEKYINNIKM